ncbi:hypothetical protein SGLAD_v1c01900 [Spiroplasma gladiatoris]|uniref:Uncharacterized protein n=1 Tax=Spiroplasma gladiatoris TaxID=2143 RepID=A0A4V1AQ62_9MOLU|nr:hypothetical protein [Spiroplasma gladiatoris]QBQ07389.1 hypothetical protein SGLAD_v1c01900 [Spiroplasma gladiatoris]
MKKLLKFLMSFALSTTVIGETTIYFIDKDKNNVSNNDQNGAPDGDNSETNGVKDLRKVIKQRVFKDLKNPTEINILTIISPYIPSLMMSDIELKDFKMNEDNNSGSFGLKAKNDSTLYYGEVKNIVFTVYKYVHEDFELEKYEISIRPKEYGEIKVKNLSSLGDYPENLPTVFTGYDEKYIDVSFDNEKKVIKIAGRGLIYKEDIKVTVQSEDKLFSKEITVKIKPFKFNFILAKEEVNMRVNDTETIAVTNWSELGDEQNQPDEVVVNEKNVVDAEIVKNGNYGANLVIRSKGVKLFDNVLELKVYSKDKDYYVKVYVNFTTTIDNTPTFGFEKANFNMLVESELKIRVQKMNTDEYKPKKVSSKSGNLKFLNYSEDETSEFGYLTFKAGNINEENIKVEVSSEKNIKPQEIYFNIKPKKMDFKLSTTTIDMKINKEATINVTNFDELLEENNYPSKFENASSENNYENYLNIKLDRSKKAIVIKAKESPKKDIQIEVRSENGFKALLNIGISVDYVPFNLERPTDMLALGEQKLKIKNFSSLKHKDNYPSIFSFNKDMKGKIDVKLDENEGCIIINSLKDEYETNLILEIKSNTGNSSKYKFNVIKPIKLEDMQNFGGHVSENSIGEILLAFKNANLGYLHIDSSEWNLLNVSDITYNSAKISTSSSNKWLVGGPIIFNFSSDYELSDVEFQTQLADEYSSHSESNTSWDNSKDILLPKKLSELKTEFEKLELEFNSYTAITNSQYNPPSNDSDFDKKQEKVKISIKLGSDLEDQIISKSESTFEIDSDLTGIVLASNTYSIKFNENSISIKLVSRAYAYRKGGNWGATKRVAAQAQVGLLSAKLTK